MNTITKNTIFAIPGEVSENLIITGNGRRGVLCVTTAEGFGESQKTLLFRMITAVGLDPEEDVWIVQTDKNRAINPSLLSLSYRYVIIFGLPPSAVSLNINHQMYKVCVLDQSKALFCDPLAVLESSQDKKKLLWESLQLMFGLK